MDGRNIRAILLMGGRGERFGSQLPKQFHRVAGKKVYLYTLESFLRMGFFETIFLVYCPGWREEIEDDVKNYPNIQLVEGGETRQESSLLGLRACGEGTEIVIIHDAVRPFVSAHTVKETIEKTISHGAVDTCIALADTIVHSEHGREISSIPNRAEYLRGQTPQGFLYPLILEAHCRTQQSNASDDCSLVLERGHPVAIVPGEERNIKITTELDLFVAEQLIHKERVLPSLAPSRSLEGKRFVITGGTGGIGSAVARFLEQEGAPPLLLSKSSHHYPVDLTTYAGVKEVFDKIHASYGEVDGLINSIGSFSLKPIDALSPEEVEQLIATNFTSLVFSCQCARIKKGGHIVNIASSSYSRGRKNYAVYSSTKAAVVNFTQGLAEERPEMRINALVPQRTNTSMRRAFFSEEDPATLLSPEAVAEQIVRLLKHPEITGSIIEVRL
jgi:ribitol-5-phosphate 2-dehydrogenase (NADP+) / D-ribitol-5-phosphate cytidylyltransferase